MDSIKVIAPILTPFRETGEIHYDTYRKLAQFLISEGIDGLFVGGTTGEFVNLTVEERIAQLKAISEMEMPPRILLFNISALNIRDVRRLCDAAVTHRATAVSVTLPYYHGYDELALEQYCMDVAQIVDGRLPIWLYNIPAMAKNSITADMFERLVAADCGIVGIKDSSMNHETTVAFLEIARRYSCDERHITVLTGNDADFLDCVRCGCDGAIVATASVLPRSVCDIKEAFLSVNQGLAEQRQSLITQVRSLCRSVMPIMTHKKILEMVCGISMGPARFPHRELTETELKTISDKLHALHLML